MVEACESSLRKFHYKKEVIMYWYGVLTEAIIHIEFETGNEMPEATWEKYEAVCEMATRIINSL